MGEELGRLVGLFVGFLERTFWDGFGDGSAVGISLGFIDFVGLLEGCEEGNCDGDSVMPVGYEVGLLTLIIKLPVG